MSDFNIGGSWSFNVLSSPGLVNLITPNAIYFDPGSGLFTFGASGGAAFDPASSYVTSGNWTNSGDWEFDGGFNVFSNAQINIQNNGSGANIVINSDGDLFLQATNGGKQVNIFGDGFNFSSQQTANFNSVNADVNVNANSGTLNLTGLNLNIDSTNGMNIASTVGGGININTTAGDLNLTAGTGPTSGNLNMSSQQGNIFLNATGTGGQFGVNADQSINLNSANSNVSLNTATANISAGPGGIGMGVAAGSGMSVNDVTGDFSFGASTGSFLIGALANSVDIVSGTIMTLSATTQLDLEAANITLSLITTQTPVAAAPTISLPAGFAYVIMDTTSKQVFYMS